MRGVFRHRGTPNFQFYLQTRSFCKCLNNGWSVFIEVAFDIVNSLLSIHDGEMTPEKIGIVTPYAAQVSYFKRMFANKRIYKGLEIKSVDGYQGREKEVIIFSTVRSNEFGNVGFVADKRRINVALTRARRGLVVVGNYDVMCFLFCWLSGGWDFTWGQ